IRSGRPGESAVMAGDKLAREFDGRLEDLPGAGRPELKSISPAVADAAYCQIMAGIELGRRIAALSDDRITMRISSSSDAIQFCQSHLPGWSAMRARKSFTLSRWTPKTR
ncbi:MAG: hypothetical protein ACR2NP_11255, partial [Pirellulaceae bacterium]